MDRCWTVLPRRYRGSRVHQPCRSAEQVAFGFRSGFGRYSPQAYQRTDCSMMTDQLFGNGYRWGQRIPVDIPIQVAAHASPAIHGRLKNLSLSGGLMEADHELRLHAYIEISIKLPETGPNAIRVMARVTRRLNNGVGVEWCEFAPSTVKDLLRSPSIRLPDPSARVEHQP